MLLAIAFVVLVLLTIYAYQAVKAATKIKWIRYLYLLISTIIIVNFFARMLQPEKAEVFQGARAYAFGFILALVLAQIVVVVFMFAEDIARALIGFFTKRTYKTGEFYMPSRRSFVAKIALGLAAIPFASLLYGMYKGKYDFRVLRYDLVFEDLPDAFDGYQITQISDIHCGSFDNKEKIAYGVDLIKQQKSDVIFFTGDLVNNRTKETDNWKNLFGSISAPDGVFSILGNHDYGDYYEWDSAEAKQQNLEELKRVQRQEMKWDLLLNERREIKRNGQKIHIVGVQNWGNGRFSKYGDIDKAAEGLTKDDFKIVLSHDPSYWRDKIQSDAKNYQLTLSGHTHGMQFGIEIPGFVRWSPIEYRYKYWAGIYKEQNRYINVNRGFGYLAYPGRVGIWPEITVIRLRKKKIAST